MRREYAVYPGKKGFTEKEKTYEIQQRMLVTIGRGAVLCTGRGVFYYENGDRGDDPGTDEPCV